MNDMASSLDVPHRFAGGTAAAWTRIDGVGLAAFAGRYCIIS
jgi:hypothetical protein